MPMMVEIRSRWSGAILVSVKSESLKRALGESVKSGADLRGADLRGADLRGADLRTADLRAADLGGADLRGANMAFGIRSDGHYFIGTRVDGVIRIRAGCRDFTLSEARQHWTTTRAGTQLGDESLALVDHIQRMLEIAEQYKA